MPDQSPHHSRESEIRKLYEAATQTQEYIAWQTALDAVLAKEEERETNLDPDMLPRSELENTILKIMRDPPVSMLMEAGEVAALLYNPEPLTEFCDPTEFQCARTAQILRDMAKRGLIHEIVPAEESYFIDKKFVSERETAAGSEYVTVMVKAGQDYITISNAVAALRELYPGLPPSTGLVKWFADHPDDRVNDRAAGHAEPEEQPAATPTLKSRADRIRELAKARQLAIAAEEDDWTMADFPPAETDIEMAIAIARSGAFLDPEAATQNYIYCELLPPGPAFDAVGDGAAYTAEMAMAHAWVHYWQPNVRADMVVEDGSVPRQVPAGWRFKLTPCMPGRCLNGLLRRVGAQHLGQADDKN